MAVNQGLALTEEQRDLQGTLRDFLTDRLPSAALRAAIETEQGYDAGLWRRMAKELGLAGLCVPEEYGGLGLGPQEAAIVHQELGRALDPGPFLANSLATTALLASGDTAACKQRLPDLAEGESIGAFAAADTKGRWDAETGSVRAERGGGEWRLTGQRSFVIAGLAADVLVVPALTESGPSLFLVDSEADGLTAHGMPGLDLTRKLAVLDFNSTPAVLIGTEGQARPVLDAVRHTFLLATAAEAAGGIDWCLAASVEHAKTREQFGRPIGSFQAVAHTCVEMLAQLEFSRAAVRYAAVATTQGADDAPMAVQVAALRAGEGYRTVTEAAIHVFGGTGFTWEHDAHLYYRRAWSGQQLAGGPQAHREAIAELVGL